MFLRGPANRFSPPVVPAFGRGGTYLKPRSRELFPFKSPIPKKDVRPMILLAVIILVTMTLSTLCSLAEACLLSLSRPDLARLIEQRPAAGMIWQRLKSNIQIPIAAILIVNTCANIGGGVFHRPGGLEARARKMEHRFLDRVCLRADTVVRDPAEDPRGPPQPPDRRRRGLNRSVLSSSSSRLSSGLSNSSTGPSPGENGIRPTPPSAT